MKHLSTLACLAAAATLLPLANANAQQRAQYQELVAAHARANNVPEALVHRVIVRESKYHPGLVGRGGTIGLMQIKLATARGLGYTGDAAGLRDPDTNLAYGIKYLAGAYRAANSDHGRAVRYYASGYYYAAKRERLERAKHPGPLLAGAPPNEPFTQVPAMDASAASEAGAAAMPVVTAAKPKRPARKLVDAKAQVLRPPAAFLGGAPATQPR